MKELETLKSYRRFLVSDQILEFDKAISELEALQQHIKDLESQMSSNPLQLTCDGCVLEDEPSGTYLQRELAYNHCFTCSRGHKDHFKQKDTK